MPMQISPFNSKPVLRYAGAKIIEEIKSPPQIEKFDTSSKEKVDLEVIITIICTYLFFIV